MTWDIIGELQVTDISLFPADRPECQGLNVSQRFRRVRDPDERNHKLGGEGAPLPC